MASGQTTNYGLNQWAANDKILRVEFNRDNVTIAQVLDTIPQLVLGSYIGDGQATRLIDIGFTPAALYVVASDGMSFREFNGASQFCGGLVFQGKPALDIYKQRMILEICENGFRVAYNVENSMYLYTNQPNMTYHYIALR